jgi:hypothetical protein
MGYDLLWSLVVFAILVSAVIYYGITDAPEDGKAPEPNNPTADKAGSAEEESPSDVGKPL